MTPRESAKLHRDGVEHGVTHYANKAATACPSLQSKPITAHMLRHTAAMRLLHAGGDTSVIAPFLVGLIRKNITIA